MISIPEVRAGITSCLSGCNFVDFLHLLTGTPHGNPPFRVETATRFHLKYFEQGGGELFIWNFRKP